MTKYELRLRSVREVVQVDVVPRGRYGLEDTRLVVGGVVAYPEPITVDGVSHVKSQPRVERLVDDGMRRFGEKI